MNHFKSVDSILGCKTLSEDLNSYLCLWDLSSDHLSFEQRITYSVIDIPSVTTSKQSTYSRRTNRVSELFRSHRTVQLHLRGRCFIVLASE